MLAALEGEFEFRKHALSTNQVVGSSAVLERLLLLSSVRDQARILVPEARPGHA